MKLLIMDTEGEGTGIDLALRAKDHEHEVRYWLPKTRAGNFRPYGDGLVDKPADWHPSMDWADLIILTGNNKYEDDLAEYFGKGYPILGTNAKAAALELDRGHGQEILAKYGIDTIPFKTVTSIAEAISHVVKTGKGYAIKPWGGDSNSAMTCVCKTPDEAVFTLTRWKDQGVTGALMLQELVKGVEIGISGWFGPGGWLSIWEESFEHKRFMNDDLGENTGEMGTVIRHVEKSKLADMVLEPLTDYLHECNYVGDCAVNCIIDDKGQVHPLEFTMRLGWPDFCIRQEVIRGDPVEWIYDLVHGRDTLVASPKIAVGITLVHGDFPKCKDPVGTWAGFPIEGLTEAVYPHCHFQQVMMDSTPRVVGKKVEQLEMICTGGTYPLVVTGSANTVSTGAERALAMARLIDLPSNLMYRTDIGKRLKRDLPAIQKFGFAKGMVY